MIDQQGTEPVVDPRILLRILRRRFWIIALCGLIMPAAAFGYSSLAEEKYRASASLLFRDPQLDEKLFGSTFVQESTDVAREAATNLKLISLDIVAARTARAVGGGLSASEVGRQVEASTEGQEDVVTIEATSRDGAQAAQLANEFGRQYILFRRDADRSKITEAIELVERQLDRLPADENSSESERSLRRRLQELQFFTSLQTGNAELVERAQPATVPFSPRPLRSAAVGLVLGLLLGIGVAFGVERIDRRLRDPEELRDIFGRPVLAIVPHNRELAGVIGSPSAILLEPFRMLRANLRYFAADREVRSVLVTSAQPGDGKTTIAWNLASASAAAGTPTLLIEADLRRPGLNPWGSRRTAGLSGLLSQQSGFDQVIEESTGPNGDGPRPTRNLDVIFAGPNPPNPDELIDSERMRDLLRVAERRYELVVIDTPPTSVVSDAIPLVQEVSGVLVIGRLGQTTREAAVRLASQLQNLQARVLGIVVNDAPRSEAVSYYDGYSLERPETEKITPARL